MFSCFSTGGVLTKAKDPGMRDQYGQSHLWPLSQCTDPLPEMLTQVRKGLKHQRGLSRKIAMTTSSSCACGSQLVKEMQERPLNILLKRP